MALLMWSLAAGGRQTGGAPFVGDHESPEVGGEPSLQAAHRFVACLTFDDLRVKVDATSAVAHSNLSDRDEMDRRVQLLMTAAREPVP